MSPLESVKPLTAVLVKPAGADCNLECAYCFYAKKAALYPEARRHRMSEAVLEELVRQVMRDGAPSVSFGWQGGEPTLMGLDFFKQAIEFQKRYGFPGQAVGNGLQTNGLLLDEAWCEFLKEYEWLVGLSLDGPRHVHDQHRLDKGGEPTWDRVTRAARLMRRSGVAVNALCVVNAHSAPFADEVYDFYKSEGLRHMQFIPCVELDPQNSASVAPFSVPPEAYGEFMCRVFDRWGRDFKNNTPTTSIRWIDSIFHTYVGFDPPECTLLHECGVYTVVEHNGDIYACDFYVEPHWKLGNLMEDNILELLNSARQGEFGRRKSQLPPECVDCRWLRHCQGGCPKDRLTNPATGDANHLCRAYRMFFEHADTRLRTLANKWLAQQRQRERRASLSRH